MDDYSVKYWNVDLTSDELIMDCTLTRLQADNAERAEHLALHLMQCPGDWRVTGIDRA